MVYLKAPETPRELLTIINRWQREHEERPASPQQTAMTQVYSAIRDLFPVQGGQQRVISMSNLRTALFEAFPDLQQQVYDANAAAQ